MNVGDRFLSINQILCILLCIYVKDVSVNDILVSVNHVSRIKAKEREREREKTDKKKKKLKNVGGSQRKYSK